MADGQANVIAFLSRPETYGPGVSEVERHETHGSIVFLAGDFAYKLKRAVRFPYMDYSTLELRRAMCERELKVNRRAAADLYLEVRPILIDASANLKWGGTHTDGNAVDWVVVMRRFAQADLLEEMRKANQLTQPLMRSLAESIAAFHATAERTPTHGGVQGLAAVVTENIAILGGMAGRPFPADAIAEFARKSRSALADIAALLDRRRKTGFVRACHGDLHLNNICIVEGKPVLFDAIEFNDAFSDIDVFYDLAFLLMDLIRQRLIDFANTVLNRYLELTWDYGALRALPLFLSCRAAVRAHVTISGHPDGARDEEALDLLRLALASLEPARPSLVAIGGVSGTGKSTLAYLLAPKLRQQPGAVVIRSDLVRKHLFGVSETTRLPESAYAPGATDRVYATMGQMAGEALRAGYSVIADAVFGDLALRRKIETIARTSGCPFTGIWLEAPQEQIIARLAQRRGDASDADIEILRQQLATVTPPRSWAHLDAGAAATDCMAKAEKLLKLPRQSLI